MKRRNFFSKIAKGLLGIGIVTALPTPEVETAPEITDSDLNILRQRLNRTYTIGGTDSPKGMVEIGNELYITEPLPTGMTFDGKHIRFRVVKDYTVRP